MAFHVVRNDITKMNVDAIVNTAHPHAKYGNGVDYAIYKAAGDELLIERTRIGTINPGEAKYTTSCKLHSKNVKYIIHTVSKKWIDGSSAECEVLQNCYRSSLRLADSLKCKSIAFPLLGTGVYGVPRKISIQIAISEITKYLLSIPNEKTFDVYLVLFDYQSILDAKRVWPIIEEMIDDNYACSSINSEYNDENKKYKELNNQPILMEENEKADNSDEIKLIHSNINPIEYINHYRNYTFLDYFQKVIDSRNNDLKQKNSQIYTDAKISKQEFSDIMLGNKVPKEWVLWRLILALKLSSEQANLLINLASNSLYISDRKRYEYLQDCIKNKYYDLDKICEYIEEHGMLSLSRKSLKEKAQ